MWQKYRCKDFSQTGNVTLPNQWRQRFGLTPGRQAEICYDEDGILIKKPEQNSTNNKRYISEKGAIHIPKEIRDISGIQPHQEFCLFVNEQEKCFILKVI